MSMAGSRPGGASMGAPGSARSEMVYDYDDINGLDVFAFFDDWESSKFIESLFLFCGRVFQILLRSAWMINFFTVYVF
jgi:hypothetical protein